MAKYKNWYPSLTEQSKSTRTSNWQQSSNSGRNWFVISIDSVLWVCRRFMFELTDLSGRELSNMFERSLPDNLSVVCPLYIGVVAVLSGSFRGRVVLISATDGRWFVSPRSGICRQTWHGFKADSRPKQLRNNIKLRGVGRHIPESKRVPDISRAQIECKPMTLLWRHTCM